MKSKELMEKISIPFKLKVARILFNRHFQGLFHYISGGAKTLGQACMWLAMTAIYFTNE